MSAKFEKSNVSGKASCDGAPVKEEERAGVKLERSLSENLNEGKEKLEIIQIGNLNVERNRSAETVAKKEQIS